MIDIERRVYFNPKIAV